MCMRVCVCVYNQSTYVTSLPKSLFSMPAGHRPLPPFPTSSGTTLPWATLTF